MLDQRSCRGGTRAGSSTENIFHYQMDVYRETSEKSFKQYEKKVSPWIFILEPYETTVNNNREFIVIYCNSSLQSGFPNTDHGSFLHLRVEQHERVERAGGER